MVETCFSPFCVLLCVQVFLVAHPYVLVTCPGRPESDLSSQDYVWSCSQCPSPLWLPLAYFAWGCWWLNSVLDDMEERHLKYCSRCKSQCATVAASNGLTSVRWYDTPHCFLLLQAIYRLLHFDLLSKTEWIPFVCKQQLGERKG